MPYSLENAWNIYNELEAALPSSAYDAFTMKVDWLDYLDEIEALERLAENLLYVEQSTSIPKYLNRIQSNTVILRKIEKPILGYKQDFSTIEKVLERKRIELEKENEELDEAISQFRNSIFIEDDLMSEIIDLKLLT